MTRVDPRQSVEFEPAALRRGRRRVDPAVLGVALVVVALAVAVIKPWAGPGSDVAEIAATSPNPAVDPSASTGTDGPLPAKPALAGSLRWRDVEALVEPRNGWGIEAILGPPGPQPTDAGRAFSERWTPIREPAGDDAQTVLQADVRPMVGLGVTYPAGHAPLDVRVWRRSSTGALYWVDAQPIARMPAQGGLIFVPPISDPAAPAWGAGEYRIDLLLGSGDIRRFEVKIPEGDTTIPPSSMDPPQVPEVVTGSAADPSTVPPGLFATIDHVAHGIESVPGSPLDEAAAWLDTEPGSGRIPANHVAVATMPRATGLGVRLADGSRLRSASIERLAPGPFREAPTPLGGGVIDRRGADPWVVFAARRGDAWAPGVYRIQVKWSDDAGLHHASWHLELRPGPSTGPPPLLGLARAWARHAGGTGLVVGRAEPLEGGPRSSAIRLIQLVDPAEAPDASAAALGCEGTVVGGTPAAFGLAHPVDDHWVVTRVSWVDATLRAMGELTTVQTTDAVPGLSLIAPADGESFTPGIYRIAVQSGPIQRTFTLCVGLAGTASQ